MPALPKRPAPKPPLESVCSPEFRDSYDIVYLNGTAHIKVAVDVKLSRNYQSCGLQAGMEFTTKADLADDAIANGFRKLRAAIAPQIAEASTTLDGL
jgi:hypothetical protein